MTRLRLALRAAAFTALFFLLTERRWCIRRIQTSDRSVRSRVLYPAELRMQNGGEAGIRTPDAAFDRILPQQGGLQPLVHLTTQHASCECFEELVSALRRCDGAHIASETYKSNNFRELFRLHTSRAISLQKTAKRVFYQQEIALTATQKRQRKNDVRRIKQREDVARRNRRRKRKN